MGAGGGIPWLGRKRQEKRAGIGSREYVAGLKLNPQSHFALMIICISLKPASKASKRPISGDGNKLLAFLCFSRPKWEGHLPLLLLLLVCGFRPVIFFFWGMLSWA